MVTVAEAAQALGITEKAVRRRIERGVLPSAVGANGRRLIPASAVGLGMPDEASPPTVSQRYPAPAATGVFGPEVFDRLERLARENGQLRQIEQIAGAEREALIRARARILELEARLARSRWPWRRRDRS